MKNISLTFSERVISPVYLPSCKKIQTHFQYPSFSRSSFGIPSTNLLSLREKLKQLFISKQTTSNFSVKEKMRTLSPTYTNKIGWELVDQLQNSVGNPNISSYSLNCLTQYLIKTGLYDSNIIEGILSNPNCDARTTEIIFENMVSLYVKRKDKTNILKIIISTYLDIEKLIIQMVLEKPNENYLYRIALSEPTYFVRLLASAENTPSWVLNRIIKYLDGQSEYNFITSMDVLLHQNLAYDTIIANYPRLDDLNREILKNREDWKNIVPLIIKRYYPEIDNDLPFEWLEEFAEQLNR